MKNPERLMQIKTTGLRKVGKVLLWVLVCFLLLKGVISILDNKSQAELQRTIDDYRTAAEQRETVRSGAAAFAENFVYEYYSFDGNTNSEYADKLSRYLAKSMDIPNPIGSRIVTEVLSARALKINFAGQDKLDVDISAKIRYSGDETSTSGAISDKDLCIRVPVAYQDGKYAVDSMPIFIPQENAADIARAEGYGGTEVSQSEEKEIKQVLESFFKTYYEGTDQEVAYYISDHSKINHGLAGVFTFCGVKRISAYYLKSSKEYLVEAVVSVSDNGQELEQNMYVYLTEGDSKYFINDITTRVK